MIFIDVKLVILQSNPVKGPCYIFFSAPGTFPNKHPQLPQHRGKFTSSNVSTRGLPQVLDTIYEKANTATAQVAHDFRVASALGGEALIKAMEKMEEMPEAEISGGGCLMVDFLGAF